MKKTCIALLFLCAACATAGTESVSLGDVTLMAENYPPITIQGKKGIEGISVDIWDALNKKAGTVSKKDKATKVWSDVYNEVKTKDNLAVTMAWTEERAKEFKMAGPIAQARIMVVAPLAKKLFMTDANDLKQWRVAAIKDDISAQIAEKNGVTNLVYVSSNVEGLKAMQEGRADVWLYSSTSMWFVSNYPKEALGMGILYIYDTSDIMIGFSKNVPDTLVKKVQKELDGMKKSGTLREIVYKNMNKR